MIVLGLTGSIGMGKSTVAAMMGRMGIASHDSDEVARAAIGPGGSAVAEVSAAFPDTYDKKTDSIDRQKLGPVVFADPEKRRRLEAIVHPHVWESQRQFLQKQKALGARFAVLDIPLLYETGAETRVDCVIVVSCPARTQRRRVLARPGMTAEKFENIVASQMPDAEKRRRADFVVQTGLGMAMTQRSIQKIINTLSRDKKHDPDSGGLPPRPL